MSGDRIKDLLHEVADGVEPGDRLEAIRSATSDRRRTGRGWWAAGGVGLVAASVVTALALSTGGDPSRTADDPAAPAPTSTASAPDDATCCRVVSVYLVGDTPDGPRLYREFQAGDDPDESAEMFALNAALAGEAVDPDYGSRWPEDASVGGYLMDESLLTISLEGDVHDRPAGMSEADAQLAVEQVVRTAQGVFGEGRVPVRLLIDNAPTDQVLGVPTSEPLAAGSDLDVLAHVSLTAPAEGKEVDNDGGLIVDGLANSFEGNVVITVERVEDGEVLVEEPTIAGTYEDRLFPFTVRLNVFDVPAGDYLVRARTDDPSGEGRFHTDTRRITVVD